MRVEDEKSVRTPKVAVQHDPEAVDRRDVLIQMALTSVGQVVGIKDRHSVPQRPLVRIGPISSYTRPVIRLQDNDRRSVGVGQDRINTLFESRSNVNKLVTITQPFLPAAYCLRLGQRERLRLVAMFSVWTKEEWPVRRNNVCKDELWTWNLRDSLKMVEGREDDLALDFRRLFQPFTNKIANLCIAEGIKVCEDQAGRSVNHQALEGINTPPDSKLFQSRHIGHKEVLGVV